MTPRLGVRLIGPCHHCRTPVYARHRNRMYCSRACAQAAYRQRLPKVEAQMIGPCPHCQRPVHARHGRQVYCSGACCDAASRYRLWRAEEGLQTEEELDRLIERRRATMPADK